MGEPPGGIPAGDPRDPPLGLPQGNAEEGVATSKLLLLLALPPPDVGEMSKIEEAEESGLALESFSPPREGEAARGFPTQR